MAVAFAFADPVLSAVREKSLQTGLVDAMLYAEATSLTLALTDMVKLAVRRPRPRAYIDAELHKDDPNYSNTSTDSALSFFSLHASMTASIGATATYWGFARAEFMETLGHARARNWPYDVLINRKSSCG